MLRRSSEKAGFGGVAGWKTFFALVSVIVAGGSERVAMAGASLYLNGKVYSISRDAYSIQVGTRIYSIRKEALSSEQRSKFDQAGSGVLSLILPMEAIESSKSAPTDVASAPRRAN